MAARRDAELERFFHRITSSIYELADAVRFGRGKGPTGQQRELFDLVDAGEIRLAVKSGHGTGKSSASCLIGLFWTLQEPNSLLIVNGPTMQFLRKVWLQEFSLMLDAGDPMLRRFIRPTKSKIVIAGKDSWAIEFLTAQKSQNAAGRHRDNMNIILDEASGVERDLATVMEATLTNKGGKMLMIGNPHIRDCPLFDCFQSQAHKWKGLTWNAEESGIVDHEHLEYLKDKWGESSDEYRTRVLGEFPGIDPNCMMSLEDLIACSKLPIYELATHLVPGSKKIARQYGIDLARYGGNESVVAIRQGEAIVKMQSFSGKDPNDVIDWAFKDRQDRMWNLRDVQWVPDAGGLGQGTLRRFHDLPGSNVYEFHFGRVLESREYHDEQSRAWMQLAQKVKRRKVYLPNDMRLFAQLSMRQYQMKADGTVQIESKEKFIKRVKTDSPDRADAVVMAMYDRPYDVGRVSSAASGVELGAALRGGT